MGRLGHAPKFPPHSVLELLLRRGELDMVEPTLDGMAAGGMYDLVGGGFHRYSVDARWLVPHFEKMLYDNALLVPAYLHGWLVTGRERYREVVEETVDYMLRDLRLPEGAFASSQDAGHRRSRGAHLHSGRTRRACPRSCSSRSSTAGRSFVGEPRSRPTQTAARDPRDASAAGARRQGDRVVERPRARRPRRGRRRLQAHKLLQAVVGWASSCSARCRRAGGCRSYRDGKATGTGYLDDYANVAHGLYELHVATGDLRWLAESRRLALLAVELFADDERGGFFLTPADGEALVVRTKDLDDNPIPSGNSMLAYVLLRLARIYGDDELERRAVSVLRLVRDFVPRAPSAFGWALCALDLHFATPREIAVIGSPDDEIAKAALASYDPNAVVAFGPSDDVPLLQGKDRRRRQAGRLCLRALRLPGARHGSRCPLAGRAGTTPCCIIVIVR